MSAPAVIASRSAMRMGDVRAVRKDGGIEVRFPYRESDVAAIKTIRGRRWDARLRAWILPDVPDALRALESAFGERLLIGGVSGHTDQDILEQTRLALRTRAYSAKTERAYLGWIRRYLTHRRETARPPDEPHPATIRSFLEHLAVGRSLAAKTRNQAASALAFMLRDILQVEQDREIPRAKGPPRLPAVLSHREVMAVLAALGGTPWIVASLLYSGGLRIEECLRIRVKDVDLELRQILVREGKGKRDRYVPLAHRLVEPMRRQIERVREIHRRDRARGHGWASLPGALHHKDPDAGYEIAWQFVFPARKLLTDPATGRPGRWHLHPSAIQREVKRAARRSGVDKRVTCHTFRHSFATEALRGGCDIRTLQHVMGHKDVRTTMIYLHVVEQTGLYIRSPLDRPGDPNDPAWAIDPFARAEGIPPPTPTLPSSQANPSGTRRGA